MKEFRFAFLVFTAVFIVAIILYFVSMNLGGVASFSSKTQDWGGFGSYVGGILAPAASLLAGYMVYKSFASNTYQHKLSLARDAISRLDVEIERKLDSPFNSDYLGVEYYGLPLRSVVVSLSNGEVATTEVSSKAVLALLHNMAILANSVRYYIGLLGGLPSAEQDSRWLGELEQCYWVEKYSVICSRMINVVGLDTVEEKLSAEQLSSFKVVFRGESY